MRTTTFRRFAAVQPALPLLDGWILTWRGGSVATDVAVRHLRALGCRVADPAIEAQGAGTLSLGLLQAGRRPRNVDCTIDWAGPIGLPMEDEVTVQAACGIMQVHGRKSGFPEPLGVDYASVTASVLATQGILAALIGQLRGMDLCRVTTSVAQAALLSVMQYLAAATAHDDWIEPLRPGGPPFRSEDGVHFEIEVFDATRWQQFWALLDADEPAVRQSWQPFQYRYATATCPIREELHQAAGRCPFAALVDAAAAAGVSMVRVRDVAECSTNYTAGCPPWRITTTSDGKHNAALPDSAATAQLPLEGLVVIEAGSRLQGPLAGHILQLLGAKIVRIEPPGGDLLRGMPPMAGDCSARFVAVNRGKGTVEIDLKSGAGQRAVRELVADADVFLHNWAPGKAMQLELDAGHLAAVRPGLVYAYASGWGDALGTRPPVGTDFMVQAHSGLAALVRPDGEPPAPSLMTLTDVLGGLICAQGVLAGLIARIHSGAGQRVDSSLLSAATMLQQPVLETTMAMGNTTSRAGRPVWTPLHRPLATADGFLALAAHSRAEPDRLAAVCGAKSNFPAIVERFRQESTRIWVERLANAGLAGVPVCTSLAALAIDPRFALALRHDICTLTRPPWEFSR